MARPHATGRFAPLSLGRRHTTRCTTLAATMGMVTWVHDRSADFGPPSHPTLASSLTDSNILMIQVADLPNRCQAIKVNLAHLARRHSQGCVVAFFGHQLRSHTGAAHQHATATDLQLDIMNL